MTDMQRALAMEIVALAIVALILGVGIWAWIHDNPTPEKTAEQSPRPLEDYASEIRRGVSLHEAHRIDDSTEIDTEYLTDDPWYEETLVALLDSLGERKS